MKLTAALLASAICLIFFISSSEGNLWGVAYGVDTTNCPSYDKIYNDMKEIKTYTRRVRIYSCFYCNNVCYNVTKATQSLGMELLIGLQPAPYNEFQWELLMLRDIHATLGFGNIKGITVGSETIYRKDMNTTALAAVIIETRKLLREELNSSLPVGSADIHNYFDEVLTNACDEIYINSFPYWIGINPVDVALKAMLTHYEAALAKAKGKPVIWGEMGWPTKGPNFGAAEATEAKLKEFLRPFACESKLRNHKYYWFSAYDRNSNSGETEANWGLYYTNGKRKPAFEDFTCDDYVSTIETDAESNRPRDWKDKATHDADYDGTGIQVSNPSPAPTKATTVAPTTVAPTTVAPATQSPSVAPSTGSPSASPSGNPTAVPTSQASSAPVDNGNNNNNNGGEENTGVGRQQTGGSATLFASSSLLLLISFLLM